MKIERCIEKCIFEFEGGDIDSSALHVCNAIDGSARSRYPNYGVRDRFITFLRDSYDIIEKFGLRGVNLKATKFPIGKFGESAFCFRDLAEIIYLEIRNPHAHGDEVKRGFEFSARPEGPTFGSYNFRQGTLSLPPSILVGLIASVVLAEENIDLSMEPHTAFLEFSLPMDRLYMKMKINEWWGRSNDFLSIVSFFPNYPSLAFEFEGALNGQFAQISDKSEGSEVVFGFADS